MATVTKILGGDGDPTRGYCQFEIDYDDVTRRITKFRCVNQSSVAAWGQATRLSNGKTYDNTFAKNSTVEVTIPTTAANRLQLILLPNGKLDGVEYHFMWPAPAG